MGWHLEVAKTTEASLLGAIGRIWKTQQRPGLPIPSSPGLCATVKEPAWRRGWGWGRGGVGVQFKTFSLPPPTPAWLELTDPSRACAKAQRFVFQKL